MKYIRRLEAEVFGGVIVTNILHYLAQSFKLLGGILTAFDKSAEHLAKYTPVILVAGICEERAAVGEHTHGLSHKPYLH